MRALFVFAGFKLWGAVGLRRLRFIYPSLNRTEFARVY